MNSVTLHHPQIIINLQDSAKKSILLVINQGESLKETVELFCLSHQLTHLQGQILKIVRQRLNQEESEFSQPRSQQFIPAGTDEQECTFRPRINQPRKGETRRPAHERLFQMSKQSASKQSSLQSIKDPQCTFQPKINDKSRSILRKSLQTLNSEKQDLPPPAAFVTFNKENYEGVITVRQIPEVAKYPLEVLLLLHCFFILLDDNNDNLVALEEINWALLENQASFIIYPVFKECKQHHLTFTLFIEALADQLEQLYETIIAESHYAKYIKAELIQQVRIKAESNTFNDYLTLQEFCQRYSESTHILDSIGQVPPRYRSLMSREKRI